MGCISPSMAWKSRGIPVTKSNMVWYLLQNIEARAIPTSGNAFWLSIPYRVWRRRPRQIVQMIQDRWCLGASLDDRPVSRAEQIVNMTVRPTDGWINASNAGCQGEEEVLQERATFLLNGLCHA